MSFFVICSIVECECGLVVCLVLDGNCVLFIGVSCVGVVVIGGLCWLFWVCLEWLWMNSFIV